MSHTPLGVFFNLVPSADRADIVYFVFNGSNFKLVLRLWSSLFPKETRYVQFHFTKKSLHHWAIKETKYIDSG